MSLDGRWIRRPGLARRQPPRRRVRRTPPGRAVCAAARSAELTPWSRHDVSLFVGYGRRDWRRGVPQRVRGGRRSGTRSSTAGTPLAVRRGCARKISRMKGMCYGARQHVDGKHEMASIEHRSADEEQEKVQRYM